MCFRVEISKPAAILELLTKLNLSLEGALPAAFNLGPSTALPVLWQNHTVRCAPMTWGLTPRYWKQGTKPKPLANARAESLWERANFRSLASSHHCVVLVSGFYEWQLQNGAKQPYRFTSSSESHPLCLAGIWQSVSENDQTINQCCIITTTPNVGGRSFGTNGLEAAIVAHAGLGRPLDEIEMREIVDKLGLEPQIIRFD